MSLHQTSTTTREHLGARERSESHLKGPVLVQARIAWMVLAVLALGLSFANLPSYSASLHGGSTLPGGPQLAPADLQTLQGLGLSLDSYAWFVISVNAVVLLGYVVVGVVLFWRASSDRVAWLASLSLVLFPIYLSVPIGAPPPEWTVPTESLELLGIVCLGLFFYVFPSGRFVPRWTRWLMLVWIAYETYDDFFPGTPISKSWPNFLFGFCLLVSQVAAQIYRYRRVSTPVERQQTKWVIFGIALAFGSYASAFLLAVVLPPAFFHLSLLVRVLMLLAGNLLTLLFPLSMCMAILRYRLWDIDPIINRALVYGGLTACVISLYVLVVGYLGALFRTGNNPFISLLATGLVAILFQPVRAWLQRGVNRVMYGERDMPYTVLARLGQRLEAALAPETILPTIVETVALTLKLPYVAIELVTPVDPSTPTPASSVIRAAYGVPRGTPLHWPLVYQRETLGALLVAPRAGEAFNATDQRLLADLARQAGAAAHAVRLTTALQQTRERLVLAREEERRRLRRDLHDGLGPQLAALTLKAGSARALFSQDPAEALALLKDLETTMKSAVADIRRLVYALRPPTLDERGLVAAIQECVASAGAHQRAGEEEGLQVTVEAPSCLPPLPAAVELAILRITQEALTNVVRHAGARQCVIRLALADVLCLEISDDGTGLPPEYRRGVGLASMRERAEELGGTCLVETRASGGVRVLARLPVSPNVAPLGDDGAGDHRERGRA